MPATLAEANIPYVIYTPLPHSSYCAGVFQVEAEENPQWAPYIGYVFDQFEAEDAAREATGASAVLANSGFAGDSFKEWVPPSRIAVVPLSLDAHTVRRSIGISPPNRRARDEKFKLVYAGMITQRKGLSYLVEAVNSSVHRGQIELTLIGSDQWGMGAALRRAFPRVDINICRPMSQALLWRELAQHHAFVFPTLLDGFGNAMLEALACGLPIIATDRCGAPDLGIFGEAGMQVAVSSSASIRHALDTLYEDEDRRAEMAAAASRLPIFDGWSGYASRAIGALDDILKS
ncbi:glycosyltransferase family 4 protein [Mycolicibacterium parafortuitum]|uniref:glycosyltransferase family 4 protein n=1 Tax=Mycolicibacterium parafortuitum TaxID=39692 RepID=UPI0032C4025C